MASQYYLQPTKSSATHQTHDGFLIPRAPTPNTISNRHAVGTSKDHSVGYRERDISLNAKENMPLSTTTTATGGRQRIPSLSSAKRKLSLTDIGSGDRDRDGNSSHSSTVNILNNQTHLHSNGIAVALTTKKATHNNNNNSSSSAFVSSTNATTPSLHAQSPPVLLLAPFQPAPWLDFGRVLMGTKRTLTLIVENPAEVPERLSMDTGCRMEDKGFNIDQLDPLTCPVKGGVALPLAIPPRSTMEITLSWIPVQVGPVRATATLKTASGRFAVNVRGHGEELSPVEALGFAKSKRRRSIGLSEKSTMASIQSKSVAKMMLNQSVMRSSIVGNSNNGTGMRKSTMHKDPTLSASVVNPPPPGYNTLPYATNNEMYDEKWIDKQERSFSQWLNHEFNVTVDTFSAVDPTSWSYYSHRLEYEHTRAAAFKLYQDEVSFRIVLRKVEEAIVKDRLQIRPDCNLVVDIGSKREIIDMFFTYDIRWLVLGLETITGKAAAMVPNFDRAMITTFFQKVIFHDSHLEAQFEPDRIPSNRPKYYQTMNRLILKKMLMLVLFLDKAKKARLIPSDPCLFNRDADLKASRNLLIQISNRYLLGEGDIVRRLLLMGYQVSHKQEALDEFDFTVTNLAVDLRDGVRLCRLIDLNCAGQAITATGASLTTLMKFPTLSKAHMQQNVQLALEGLVKSGIALEGTRGGVVGARDIVEGHREKTFGLLWKLILNWKITDLLDLQVLEHEIFALTKEYKRQFGRLPEDQVDAVYFTSDHLSALLRWTQAVGAFYGIGISNFTTSFSDGRGFGCLLSYYHPRLLRMEEMKDSRMYLKEYSQGLHQNEPVLPVGNDGKGWFIDTRDIKDPVTVAKEMDRFNYRLVQTKIVALGGVPVTVRHADCSHLGVPDEKAVILFLTYLCARLMHLNKDIRAAKVIQRIWRKKHYGRMEASRLEAVKVIQRRMKSFLVRKRIQDCRIQKQRFAIQLQSSCRGILARRKAVQEMETIIRLQAVCRSVLIRQKILNQISATMTIQRFYRGHVARQRFKVIQDRYRKLQQIQAQSRGYLIRKEFLLTRLATEIVISKRKAVVEGTRCREEFLRIKTAAIKIQQQWRATLMMRQARSRFLEQQRWVCGLQAMARKVLLRQKCMELIWATVMIQRQIRARNQGRVDRFLYLEKQQAAIKIQQSWRATVARRHVQHNVAILREASIVIQTFFRARRDRQMFLKQQQASITIQRQWRAFKQGSEQQDWYLQLRYSAIVIQDRWRALLEGRRVRQEFLKTRSWTIGLQTMIRAVLTRQRLRLYLEQTQAAIKIQSTWRGFVKRQNFKQYRKAALTIQDCRRRQLQTRQDRFEFLKIGWAVNRIQQWYFSIVDGNLARLQYQRLKAATIRVQSIRRGNVVRRDIKGLKMVVGVQAIVRRALIRVEFVKARQAAVVIQQHWRAFKMGQQDRNQFKEYSMAAMVIQQQWRGVLKGRQVRMELRSQQVWAIQLQAQIRGVQARVEVGHLLWLSRVQKACKGFIQRQGYRRMYTAALVCQQHFRAQRAGKLQRYQFQELVWASRVMQQQWRAILEMRRCRQEYLVTRWAAITIQQRWRRVCEARVFAQEQAQERYSAAVMIQSGIRGFLVRERIRSHFEKRDLLIQNWIRTTVWSLSAIRIQSAWRQFVDGRQRIEKELAVTRIQRWWRNQMEDRKDLILRQLVFNLQTASRGFLNRQRFYRQQHSVLLIQSWWRGHVVRQEATAKIKAARKRIEHANATAEEHMKLGNRTTMALEILLSSSQLSAVLKACYHLDVVTRLSKTSCLRLIEHNVINIIFRLVKSCNRSQPHMEILKHGLNIVENLSRDPDTIEPVFLAPQGMEILVDCVQAYRENEMVFESLVTILLLHLRDPSRQRVMQSMVAEIKKLKGVLAVLERKVERDSKSLGYISSTIGSSSAAAAAAGNGASVRRGGLTAGTAANGGGALGMRASTFGGGGASKPVGGGGGGLLAAKQTKQQYFASIAKLRTIVTLMEP